MEIVLYTYRPDVAAIVARARALKLTQVNLLLDTLPGVQETGIPDAKALKGIAQSLADEGITFDSVNGATGRNPGLLTEPEKNRAAIDAQLATLDAMGGAGVKTLLYYQHFPHPTDPDQTARYWDGLIAFMSEMADKAAETGIGIANHPVWRCIPQPTRNVALSQQVTIDGYAAFRDDGWDGPYLMSSHQDAKRLFEAVPSPANGICFCTGMYIMGATPREEVDGFKDRIHHAQMRDIRHRWPDAEEVFLGDGDIDFGEILQLLQNAGYSGVIGPEHLGDPRWVGDDPEAVAVEFLRGKLPA